MTPLAAYVLLFVAVGAAFIFVHLMAGKLFRPSKPGPEKGTIYECGEPTIGSAWVQFDLRFYVVALLFVIFDVEVAFFFPWAEVFGKANDVAAAGPLDEAASYRRTAERAWELIPPSARPSYQARFQQLEAFTQKDIARLAELRQMDQMKMSQQEREDLLNLTSVEALAARMQKQARVLGWVAFGEILVFFGVLLVGFAYLWRRGDLAWVRSLSDRQAALAAPPPPSPLAATPAAAARPLAGTAPVSH
jgi:NADH-quinone oxidoreductase subunit A